MKGFINNVTNDIICYNRDVLDNILCKPLCT